MKKKKFVLPTLFFSLTILFGFCFFSLPGENYKTYKYLGGERYWSYQNVIVRCEKIQFDIYPEVNKIVLSEGFNEDDYEIFLPPRLMSQSIDDISCAGKLYDEEGKFTQFFSYKYIAKDKFIIKDAKAIPIYNQPGEYGILELKEIKSLGGLEKNLIIVKIFLGSFFCLFLIITILLSKAEWLP